MEKAYAKLHLHYQVLNGGSVSEAMVDLTGMVAEKYELQKSAELTHSLNTGQFWRDVKKYLALGYLVSCANIVLDDENHPERGNGPKGINYNHTYSIERMVDCPDYSQQAGGL